MSSALERAESSENRPAVSVIVCTRNRKDNVLPTARSILSCDYPNFELLIIDQSDDEDTCNAISPLLQQDDRLRYLRMEVPGKPNALNHGFRHATGRYLLLTDDDCEVRRDWIEAMVNAFAQDGRIGCVFGDVEAAPCDLTLGYIPDNRILQSFTISRHRDFLFMPDKRNFGIGANMGIRVDILNQLQGWDPCIGPGAKFGTGDDHDMAMRILLSGYSLRLCSESHVIHYGMRHWEHSGADISRIGFGFGTIFAKYLRCRTFYYGSWRMMTYFVGQVFHNALRGKRPLGTAFPRNWVRGVMAGMKQPVDRIYRRFHAPDSSETARYGNFYAKVVLREQQEEKAEVPQEAGSTQEK